MVLVEFPLCFIVFPLLAALVVRGSVGAKIGFAVLSAVLSLVGDSLCTQMIPEIGGVIGAIGGGLIIVLVAASTTGKQCPLCKSRIPSSAVRCPRCQASLPQHDVQEGDWLSPRKPVSSLPHSQAEGMSRLKKCPDCAEEVRAEARKCRFCGFMFPASTEAEPEPEPTESKPAGVAENVTASVPGDLSVAAVEAAIRGTPGRSKRAPNHILLTIAAVVLTGTLVAGVLGLYRDLTTSRGALRSSDLDGDEVSDPAEALALYTAAQKRLLADHPGFRSDNFGNQVSSIIQKKGTRSMVLLHYRDGSSDRRFVYTINAAEAVKCEEK